MSLIVTFKTFPSCISGASATTTNEERETQKRKFANSPSAADNGSAKKMFVDEKQTYDDVKSNYGGTPTVTSASNESAKENETTLKHNSANKEMTITPNVESSSESNNSEDMVTKERKFLRKNF